jgi:hypothetical protein
VAVNKCTAVIGRLDFAVIAAVPAVCFCFCFFFEARRQQQGRGAFIVKIGNMMGEATRVVLVLAFSSVIRRKRQGVKWW